MAIRSNEVHALSPHPFKATMGICITVARLENRTPLTCVAGSMPYHHTTQSDIYTHEDVTLTPKILSQCYILQVSFRLISCLLNLQNVLFGFNS